MRTNSVENEPTLQDVFVGAWRYRWRINIGMLVAVAAAATYAVLAQPVYRAEVVLLPAENEFSPDTVGALGQFGGLAALVGLPQASGTPTTEALAVLRSREFSVSLVRENQLLPILYSEIWDAANTAWLVDDNDVPTLYDAADLFAQDVMSIDDDNDDGTIRVAVEWIDRELTASWANLIIRRLNEHMKERAVRDAELSIDYLNRELEKTSLVEMRRAISSLVEDQVGRIMIANIRDEYAFKVIDPAIAPRVEEFVKPRRVQIVLIAAVAALLGGVFVAAIVHINRR